MSTVKVHLRKKDITGNRQSLYLDFWPPIPHPETGRPTRREFLGVYLFEKPKDFDKQHNVEMLKVARAIRSKRENELNKPEIYTDEEKEKLRIKGLAENDFVDFFEQIALKKRVRTEAFG